MPARGKSTYKWPDCESDFPSGTVSGLGHRNGCQELVLFEAAHFGLTHSARLLHPPKHFLDQWPLVLADLIVLVTNRALIEGAAPGPFEVLRHMHPHPELPQSLHEVSRVVSLIGSHADGCAQPPAPVPLPSPVHH